MTKTQFEVTMKDLQQNSNKDDLPHQIAEHIKNFYQDLLLTDDTITIRLKEMVLLCFEHIKIPLDIKMEKDFTIKDIFQSILDDPSGNDTLRFFAFYSLFILYRRTHSYSDVDWLVSTYANRFKEQALTGIVISTNYRYKAERGDVNLLNNAIEYASDALNKIPSIKGVKVHYSELIGIALELGVEISGQQKENAKRLIQDEIDENPGYGKYYYILSRIYLSEKKFTKALVNVRLAISKEDKTKADALLRTAEYIQFQSKIEQKSEIHTIMNELETSRTESRALKEFYEQEQEKLNEELNQNRLRIVEYLTFFSGIIAFVISTMQISLRTESFSSAAGLIFIMSALLILSFGSFVLITGGIRGRGYKSSLVVVLMVVLILIALGLIVGYGSLESLMAGTK